MTLWSAPSLPRTPRPTRTARWCAAVVCAVLGVGIGVAHAGAPPEPEPSPAPGTPLGAPTLGPPLTPGTPAGTSTPAPSAPGPSPAPGTPTPAPASPPGAPPGTRTQGASPTPGELAPPDVTPPSAPSEDAPPRAVTVQVTHASAVGATRPGEGAEIVVERVVRRPGMGGETSERVWRTLAGADGVARVRVPEPRTGRQDRAWVLFGGIRYPISELRYGELMEVTVWDATPDDRALTWFVQIELIINEGAFNVNATYQAVNPTSRVIDTDRPGRALRVPLLLPAVFGDAVDEGLLPANPDPRRARLEHRPVVGRLAVERGALYFRGPVVPGAGLSVRANYAISYDDLQDYVFALRPDHDVEEMLVSVSWSDRVAPSVTPRRPFAPLIRRGADDRRRLMTVHTPPKAGEPFFLDVRGTPARLPTYRAIALAGAGLIALWIALGVFADWGRRRRARGEDG